MGTHSIKGEQAIQINPTSIHYHAIASHTHTHTQHPIAFITQLKFTHTHTTQHIALITNMAYLIKKKATIHYIFLVLALLILFNNIMLATQFTANAASTYNR